MSKPRFLAGPPEGKVELPAAIAAVKAPEDEAKPVWQNEVGGLTFRLRPARVNPCSPEYVSAGGTRYVKWVPAQPPHPLPEGVQSQYRGGDLGAEAERCKWAAQWVDVPKVLDYQHNADGELLITKGISSRSAVSPYWRARPEDAATAIGKGLRDFHKALPVADCPFSWSVEERIEHAGLTGTEIGNQLIADAPAATGDDLVVCHGDPCAPNFLIDPMGFVAGYVDLGRLGVADRWADLAVAAWSAEWNYGDGFDKYVYQGYGIKPDPEKIAYYRRLWDET